MTHPAPSPVAAGPEAASAARSVAIHLYAIDGHLGRVPVQPWSDLPPAAQATYERRGRVAMRASVDYAAMQGAREAAAREIQAVYPALADPLVARIVADAAIAGFLAALGAD